MYHLSMFGLDLLRFEHVSLIATIVTLGYLCLNGHVIYTIKIILGFDTGFIKKVHLCVYITFGHKTTIHCNRFRS